VPLAAIIILQGGLSESLQHSPAAAVVALFGAGVLTSLTPCIYPMIPITAGVLAGSAGDPVRRGRRIALTLTYVSGLALLYAFAGLLAGMTGALFGTLASSPWARLGIAALLLAFGLGMLGVLPVAAPRRALAWATRLGGDSFPGVFLLGASSGLVAAPCGAPAFAAVLTWVGTTRSAGLGFLYLFAFSLGMTALLVFVGIFSGTLAALPRGGRWMGWIKQGAGVVLLVMAGYYVQQAWIVR